MRKILAILLVLVMVGLTPVTLASDTSNRVIFQMSGEPERMDPTMNDYSGGSYALQSLFRGLYKFGEDGTIVPALAESYELSEDGTVYTFKLREDLKWSDGSPLTAHDFEYSWKRVLDPALASQTAYSLYNVVKGGREYYVDQAITADEVGVKALDDVTLQVELYAPTPYFLSLTATTAYYPVKKELVESDPDWEWNDKTYVSNGPYMLKEMRRDEKFIFAKNPYYYNADEVKLDEVEFIFLSASETALLAFENNDIDIATSVNADALDKYIDTDVMTISPRIGYRYYEIRTTRDPFTDPRVRKALAMSLDRSVITNVIMKTFETPLQGFVPHAFPDLLDDTKSWREVHGNAFEEDVEAAKALLAEAGYPNGEGIPTMRIVQTPNATLEAVAQAMAQMWKQNLNIDCEILSVESGIYWDDTSSPRRTGEYEIAYMGYTGDYLDPTSLMFIFASYDDNEVTGWANEEYDALMTLLATGISGAEREEAIEKAEAILANEFPVIPIYSYDVKTLVNERVGGFIRSYGGTPNFEYTYIK